MNVKTLAAAACIAALVSGNANAEMTATEQRALCASAANAIGSIVDARDRGVPAQRVRNIIAERSVPAVRVILLEAVELIYVTYPDGPRDVVVGGFLRGCLENDARPAAGGRKR